MTRLRKEILAALNKKPARDWKDVAISVSGTRLEIMKELNQLAIEKLISRTGPDIYLCGWEMAPAGAWALKEEIDREDPDKLNFTPAGEKLLKELFGQ